MSEQELLRIIEEAKKGENVTVWALKGPQEGPDHVTKKFHEELKNGKARFGWDQGYSLREGHEGWNSRNMFLLRIKPGDWVVYINLPYYGHCVAAKVLKEYDHDDGIAVPWGNLDPQRDFGNYVSVDPNSVIGFDRRNHNVNPNVNLRPRQRGQRVYAVEDFFESLENLVTNKYKPGDKRPFLKSRIGDTLLQITEWIHKMNKSKNLEHFLHEMFEAIPNVDSVQNGSGWKTDFGADLIVTYNNPIMEDLKTKIIVQAKSYQGRIYRTDAVDDVVKGIKEYSGDAGLLICTAEGTEEVENYVKQKSKEINKPIELVAGGDVARWVLRHAPDLIL